MTGRSGGVDCGGGGGGGPKVGPQPLRSLQTERQGETVEGRGRLGVIVTLAGLERAATHC